MNALPPGKESVGEEKLELVESSASKAPLSCDIAYFPLGAAAFGGAERSLLELASAQQKRGLRVLVFYEPALKNTDFLAQARALSLPLHEVAWAPERNLSDVVRAAWTLFSRIDARLVHFNISWRPRMWAIPVVARWVARARLVGTMRAMPDLPDDVPRRRYFGVLPGLRMWTWADFVRGRVWAKVLHLTVSVNRNDYPPRLVSEYGFSAARLQVVYNGVRIPALEPSDAIRKEARARLGLQNLPFVVAYMGRVSDEKGVRFAVQALSACDPEVHLVIAGDGPEMPELQALVGALGLVGRVHFLGYVSDPYSVFYAADVAVVPSLWNEAFGRVVVEAMASGAVVIATAVGGMQELFTDGVEGMFVPKADAPAITRAIQALVTDPARRSAMAGAARALALSRYDTVRVASDYGRLYDSMMGRDGNGSTGERT